MSQITTHILDTSQGQPARGVKVNLSKSVDDRWEMLSSGITNEDGRISDFLKAGILLEPGRYRLEFILENFFTKHGMPCFYPEASIVFLVQDQAHYHIPLLLSPFGYSTYRGS